MSLFEAQHYNILSRDRLLNHYGKHRFAFTHLASKSYGYIQNGNNQATSGKSTNPPTIGRSDILNQLCDDLLGSCVYAELLNDAGKILTIPSLPARDQVVRDALARKILDQEWGEILKLI